MNDLTMVAMSGGVDSSVTAWLLRESGQPIAGLFMKNWEDDDQDGACNAEEDAADARAVAALLGIPFHARNFAMEYWESVFEEFLFELKAGRTPNPDVLCNREIKFKVFLDHAQDLGAGSMATGHYARRVECADGFQLLKGVDPDKDQSYFLYMLDQHQMSRSLFPVGELHKSELRKLARQAGLPTAAKKDSTGICFIGERDFDTFIERYLTGEPGDILTTDGQVIGQHRGLIHYTLGQRRGLGIGGVRGFSEAPWYSVHKDLQNNRLYVTQDTFDRHLYSTELSAARLTWIAGHPPASNQPLKAKIRYRQTDQEVEIIELDPEGDYLRLRFIDRQRAVTPGQSVVLYNEQICLGGGIILNSNRRIPQA